MRPDRNGSALLSFNVFRRAHRSRGAQNPLLPFNCDVAALGKCVFLGGRRKSRLSRRLRSAGRLAGEQLVDVPLPDFHQRGRVAAEADDLVIEP